ncbi:hypothetical protein BDV25DRAFT_172258, partial [Aspergillus avenaceus]
MIMKMKTLQNILPIPLSVMEIDFADKRAMFTTGSIIKGRVFLRRRAPHQPTRVCISLIGKVTTDITNSTPYPYSGSTVDYTFLQMYQNDDIGDIEGEACSHTIPFSFIIPGALPNDTCTEHIQTGVRVRPGQSHLELPPSMDYDSDKLCPKMCEVAYYIRAVAVTGNDRVHAAKRVQILPLYLERPPQLWLEDSDASVSDSMVQKKGLWGSNMGKIKLCGLWETVSAYLPLGKGEETARLLPIRLVAELERFDERAKLPDTCQVRVTLKAVTHYTALPMVELQEPGVSDTQRKVFRVSACSWKNKSVMLHWSGHGGDSYSANTVVPIPISCRAPLLPTFYHCYVARKYFAQVEVVVRGYKTLCLKVPVQIYNALER